MQRRISRLHYRASGVALALGVVIILGLVATSAQSQSYRESLLHSFKGAPDGASPEAGVVRDAAGNLYGTALLGGDPTCTNWQGNACGIVFKVTDTGKEKVLYRFTGTPDGASPIAGVVRGSAGNLYGTTWAGLSLAAAEQCTK